MDNDCKLKDIITNKSVLSTPKKLNRVSKMHKENFSDSSAAAVCITNQTLMMTPVKRIIRVKNPFEQALAERLHLPIIASPSLFQIPQTPQMSSTAFEWTIDDVSSLKPVHVEPHETQFHDSPDPEFEAKAQSAISSYFKEQIIVPSPIECPLRRQRIRLSELNGVTPVAKTSTNSTHSRSTKSSRSVCTQTQLTFPTVLPPELEEVLAAYMQPHLALVSTPNSNIRYDSQCCSTSLSSGGGGEIYCGDGLKDTSLRRKLFDKHNIILLDSTEKLSIRSNVACSSPSTGKQRTAIAGILSDSMEKSSICSLSPISATGGFSSPDANDMSTTTANCYSQKAFSKQTPRQAGKRKAPDFLEQLQDVEDLSPISRPSPHKRHKLSSKSRLTVYRTPPNNGNCDFSVLSHFEATDMETTGVEFSISMVSHKHEMQEDNLSLNNKVNDMAVTDTELDDLDDDDVGMLLTNQSSDSSNLDTPRRANPSTTANRKNLSQSFSAAFEDDDDDDEEQVAKYKMSSNRGGGSCTFEQTNIYSKDLSIDSNEINNFSDNSKSDKISSPCSIDDDDDYGNIQNKENDTPLHITHKAYDEIKINGEPKKELASIMGCDSGFNEYSSRTKESFGVQDDEDTSIKS